MNKNTFAPTPPMGWNSYDYYDTTVNEIQVMANADYMAEHLKEYGWEYIVVDIQWYDYGAGTMREWYQYIPFGRVEMDEYSRLLPCRERFPSSEGEKGFKPLADYIHSRGLKFGIHIMRGIPRIAAHNHGKISGTDITADRIANPSSICGWNPDMYGVDAGAKGAQEYYDSLFSLYAQWGVDYVKCDDICNTNLYVNNRYSAEKEIEMLHKAIQKCGRPIVLSLSPGPALIDKAWHYEKYANMWRITDDFWDSWPLLLDMFERCEIWQKHVGEGCYPDCDMLPLGWLGKGFGKERITEFTREEQITMMTLWCIFRSPLMLGAELTKMDEWTLSLLTNRKVLALLGGNHQAQQIARDEKHAVWFSKDRESGACYAALFNFREAEASVSTDFEELGLSTGPGKAWENERDTGKEIGITDSNTDGNSEILMEELWTGEKASSKNGKITAQIGAHGAKLYRLRL